MQSYHSRVFPKIKIAQNPISKEVPKPAHLPLKSEKTLILTSQVNQIKKVKIIKQQEAQKTFREFAYLDFSNSSALDELLTDLVVKPPAEPQKLPGILQRVLDRGGILVINFENIPSAFIPTLYALLDTGIQGPRFRGKPIHPNTTIIGLITETTLLKQKCDSSLISRFSKKTLQELNLKFTENPLSQIHPVYNCPKQCTLIDLGGDPDWKANLVGTYKFDKTGLLTAQNGILVEIMKTANLLQREFHVRLDHALWDNPEFQHFFETLLIQRSLNFNGERIYLNEDIHFYKGAGLSQLLEFSSTEQESIRQKIQVTKILGLNSYVVNQAHFDELWKVPVLLASGKPAEKPGPLAEPQSAPVSISITEPLAPWQWRKLASTNQPIQIFLAAGVHMPDALQKLCKEKSTEIAPGAAVKTTSLELLPFLDQFLSIGPGEKSLFFSTTDLGLTLKCIQDKDPNTLIFPISKINSADDLMQHLERNPGASMSFKWEKSQVLEHLLAGKTVVLPNLLINPSLFSDLETLFSNPPYVIDNGIRREIPGKIIVVMDTAETKAIQTYKGTLPKIEIPQKFVLAQLIQKFKLNEEEINYLEQIIKIIPELNYNKLEKCLRFLETSKAQIQPGTKLAPSVWIRGISYCLLDELKENEAYYCQLKLKVKNVFNHTEAQIVDLRRFLKILSDIRTKQDVAKHFWPLANTFNKLKIDSHEDAAQAIYQVIYQIKHESEPEFCTFFADLLNIKSLLNPDLSLKTPLAITLRKKPILPAKAEYFKKLHKGLNCLRRNYFLFLKGSSGTGKSYLMRQLATYFSQSLEKALRDAGMSPKALAASLGVTEFALPGLFNKPCLVEGPFIVENKESFEVRLENFVKDLNPNKMHFLLVDEANLTDSHFWDFLAGIHADIPYIFLKGKKILLNNQVNIIFTGNQERFAGRSSQKTVQEHAITLIIKEYSPHYLKEEVLAPIFLCARCPEMKIDFACETILNLLNQLSRILPNHCFTKRDLQELAMRWLAKSQDLLAFHLCEVISEMYLGMLSQIEFKSLTIALNHWLDSTEKQKRTPVRSFVYPRISLPPTPGNPFCLTKTSHQFGYLVEKSLEMREFLLKHPELQTFSLRNAIMLSGPSG
ncbi:MAG: hypothetical protein WC860_04675, partial [Candidatus Margulisiibacteriota bacterium]